MKIFGIFFAEISEHFDIGIVEMFHFVSAASVGGVFRLSVPFVGRNEIVGILGEKHVKMKNRGINKTMFT